jgi:hypothetical protein
MTTYRPDHNGECLHCDEPLDAHICPTKPKPVAAQATQTPEELARDLSALVDALVNNPGALCMTCEHPARNHTLGRCRKKKCGCGGWRGSAAMTTPRER